MAEQFLTLMADLDDESQAKMSDLYEKLQEKGFTGVQTSGLPFHISLASYPLDKEKDVIELIKKVSVEYSPVPIGISHIGVFSGGKVMFGAPDMNSGLTSLHEACLMVDSLQEYGWTPHVTIIIDEPEIIGNALPIIGRAFEPFHGRVVRLHLCAFWPTREIITVELGK